MQGGQIIQGPRGVLMTPDLRQKLIRQGGGVISQQVIMQGGQQIVVGGQRMPIMQQQIIQGQSGADHNVILSQRLQRPMLQQQNQGQNQGQGQEGQEIPDIVTAEIEKLEQEQDEALPGEEVGDILGKLGDDDDELLTSLTAEMGDEFNLLEYADPELDTNESGEKTNLFDSLELDEHLDAADKDEKHKDP